MLRNLTRTHWNWPLIRAWLAVATFALAAWGGIFWVVARLVNALS